MNFKKIIESLITAAVIGLCVGYMTMVRVSTKVDLLYEQVKLINSENSAAHTEITNLIINHMVTTKR